MPIPPSLSVWVPARPGGPIDRQQRLSAAVFDLDGTLADTRPIIVATLTQLLREEGKAPKRFGDAASLRFPESLARLGLEHRRAQYWTTYIKYARSAQFFPWAIPLLRRLREHGVRTGVVTAIPPHIAWAVILAAGAESLLEVLVGAGEAPPKPDPGGIQLALKRLGVVPEEAIVVGDSPEDIGAGSAARSMTVGCGWGFHPLLDLAEAGADITFHVGEAFASWLSYSPHPPTLANQVQHPQTDRAQVATTLAAFANIFPMPELACVSCGKPTPDGATCNDCRRRNEVDDNWVESVRCAWLYVKGGPLANVIHDFKGVVGRAQRELAIPLGQQLLPASFVRGTNYSSNTAFLHALPGPLVPVPSSKTSRTQRGFAPVEELLSAYFTPLLQRTAPTRLDRRALDPNAPTLTWPAVIAAVNGLGTGWEILDALTKVEDQELKNHGARVRAAIAARAYRVRPEMAVRLRGRDVYLVEDVITTGATIQACAQLLRQQGARAVHVIALARTHDLQRNRTTVKCPECREGILRLQYRRRDNKPFYGCSRWRRDDHVSCGYTCEVEALDDQTYNVARPPYNIALRTLDEEDIPF